MEENSLGEKKQGLDRAEELAERDELEAANRRKKRKMALCAVAYLYKKELAERGAQTA